MKKNAYSIKNNLKLTFESIIIIIAEIVKVLGYWIMIKSDTKKIYKKVKSWIKKFKKKLWK